MSTVLVVEDESDVLEILQDALERRGLQVRVAGDDRSAYDLLQQEGRSFGAIVTDINLGVGTTGFDVARRARQLNPDLKVIYITGDAALLDRFGVPDSLMFPKPFYPEDLADCVAGLVAPRPEEG